MNGAQESFVVVTAPAGVVFVAALPANFEVAQLNTMYFKAGGRYYVPYLAPDGSEKYVMVDNPPTPSDADGTAHGGGATAPGQGATGSPGNGGGRRGPPAPAAAPVRAVVEHLEVPTGTLLVVRLATEVSSATAQRRQPLPGLPRPGPRGQRPLDRAARYEGLRRRERGGCGQQDEGPPDVERDADGHADRRPRACRSRHSPSVPREVPRAGAKKLVGGAALGATIGGIAGGGDGAAIGAAVGAGVGGAAAAASSVKPAVIAAQTPASVHAGRAAAGGDHDERGRTLRQEMNMTTRHSGLMWIAGALALIVLGMAAPQAAQDVQQKLAAAKQAAALNQQALRSYSWLEKTELSLQGRGEEHEGRHVPLRTRRQGAEVTRRRAGPRLRRSAD